MRSFLFISVVNKNARVGGDATYSVLRTEKFHLSREGNIGTSEPNTNFTLYTLHCATTQRNAES